MNRLAPAAWIISFALLAGCDRPAGEPERDTNVASAPVAADANAANQAQGTDSVIRQEVLEETEAEPAPPPERIELTIPFADSDGALPEAAGAAMSDFASQPAIARAECILVSGHTDSRGSDQQNLRASQRRAELVRDALAERGIAAERVRVIALGERRPIAPNAQADGSDYPEGRAKNRRVTVRAVKAGPEAATLCGAGADAEPAPAAQ